MEISRDFCAKCWHLISGLKNGRYLTSFSRLVRFCCGNFAGFSNKGFLSSPLRLANSCGENSVGCSNLFSILKSKKISLAGFTLAEVLITLGVIGIVVAVTLPALIADHREKQTVNQVLAFYSKLSQATQYIINEEGDPGVWLIRGNRNNLNILSNKYKKYMKVLTDCGQTSSTGCVAPEYRHAAKTIVPGSIFSGSGSSRYSMILQDGSAVAFYVENAFSVNSNNRNKKTYARIYYDTNGVKPPNQFGYDMYQFDLTDDGIYVYSDKEFRGEVYPRGYCDSYWIITHKNLDFQRCPDELKKGALGCKKKKK